LPAIIIIIIIIIILSYSICRVLEKLTGSRLDKKLPATTTIIIIIIIIIIFLPLLIDAMFYLAPATEYACVI
jgi:hypothetical protein